MKNLLRHLPFLQIVYFDRIICDKTKNIVTFFEKCMCFRIDYVNLHDFCP